MSKLPISLNKIKDFETRQVLAAIIRVLNLNDSDFLDHSLRHQDGGGDEVAITNLSGEAADLQKPKDHTHQSSGSGVGGKLDHGLALDGLSDDDHPQYLHLNKASQNIAQSVTVTAGQTIDGVDISDHSARHEDGGADELDLTGLNLKYLWKEWDGFDEQDFTHWHVGAAGSGSYGNDYRTAVATSGGTAGGYGFVDINAMVEDTYLLNFDKKSIIEAFVRPTAFSNNGVLQFRLSATAGSSAPLTGRGYGIRIRYCVEDEFSPGVPVAAGMYFVAVWHNGTSQYEGMSTTVAPVANTWYKLRAEFRIETGTIKFYVNDTLIATASANLPSGTNTNVWLALVAHNGADNSENRIAMKKMAFAFEHP